MAVAKVILNGTTLIDTTQKTVTAGSMLNGVTALKNDGTDITGNIASKTSSDLTASGDTITAPAGYYASSASKAVSSGSASTPATTITANPSISVSSGGLITASVSASQSVTPTVSAGYVSSGTAGTVSVSGSNTSQLTTQAAQTIHPSATDQTIASGKYLTGTQTVKGVLLTNLSADNIKKDVVVKIGDSTDDDCVTSVTGTYEGGGGGGAVTISLSQMGGMFDHLYAPSSATVETDPDSPWITYIRNLPANSLIVGLVSMSMIPTCSAGITYVSSSFGTRPTWHSYAFTIGDTDGSIAI